MANNSSISTPSTMFLVETTLYLTLSSINVTTSLFSLVLFCRYGKQEIHRVLRTLLIFLSFFESLFHSCIIIFYLTYSVSSTLSANFKAAFPIMLRFALTMRNWSVVMISWSRVEAVVRPMSSRVGTTLFTGYRLVLLMGFIVSISIALSVLMQLIQKSFPENLVRSFVYEKDLFRTVENVFFTYQVVLPTVLVVTATVITITFLRRQTVFRRSLVQGSRNRPCAFRPVSQREDGTPQSLPTGQPSMRLMSRTSTSSGRDVNHACQHRSRKDHQAVKIIVAVSVIFAVLELPTAILSFMMLESGLKYKVISVIMVNVLVEIDSVGNFIVYTCNTKLFRTVLRRLCRSEDSLQSHLNCLNVMSHNSSHTSDRGIQRRNPGRTCLMSS